MQMKSMQCKGFEIGAALPNDLLIIGQRLRQTRLSLELVLW